MAQRFGRNKRRRLHEEAERMAQELRIAKIEVEIDKRRFAAEYEWRTARAVCCFFCARTWAAQLFYKNFAKRY